MQELKALPKGDLSTSWLYLLSLYKVGQYRYACPKDAHHAPEAHSLFINASKAFAPDVETL